jgi:hypothetical protein
MLATFMILVRFLDSDCRNAIASPSALAGQAGFSWIAGAARAAIASRACPRAAVRKPQPVLDQDVLDKDINALNETTDVETEN